MNFVRGGYQSALLPGILAVSLATSAIQSVALPMVQDFGWTKEIEDRLLAPVPTGVGGAAKGVWGDPGDGGRAVRAAHRPLDHGADPEPHLRPPWRRGRDHPPRRRGVLGV